MGQDKMKRFPLIYHEIAVRRGSIKMFIGLINPF
jgi:hypothetical protein